MSFNNIPRNPLYLYIFAILLFFNGKSAAIAQVNGLVVTDNGLSGVIITYEPVVRTSTINIDGNIYTKFTIDKSQTDQKPGEPVIPFRTVIIALPGNSNPVVRILNSDFTPVQNITAEIAEGVADSDADFPNDAWLNEKTAEIIESGYFRTQRIMTLRLNPVRYNPRRNEAAIASKIVVQVDFNAEPREQGITGSDVIDGESENLYKSLFENYESAKKWRRPPDTKSFRKPGQLSQGAWYTFPVTNEGIYQVTYSNLVSAGLTPENIDPGTVKIFNNGGTMLPEDVYDERPEGMIENAIRFIGDNDGSFESDEYILFYGRGTEIWRWNEKSRNIRHSKNLYANRNLYWFTYGGLQGKRMKSQSLFQTGTSPVTTGKSLVFREDEKIKMFHSGSNWFMDEISPDSPKEYDITLEGMLPGEKVIIRSGVSIKRLWEIGAVSPQYISTKVNGVQININSVFSSYLNNIITNEVFSLEDENFTLRIENRTSSPLAILFYDWYEVEYSRDLTARDGTLKFQAPVQTGQVSFEISGFGSDDFDIYNVSDFGDVYSLEFNYNIASGSALFADTLKNDHQQYFAVGQDKYLSIGSMTPMPNSDLRTGLRSTDMIIITPREFAEAAVPLKQFHEVNDKLMTEIVIVDEIYNEFSCGMQDPAAIRDFVRYAFLNWVDEQNNPPGYLLLFGDGNYDYYGIRSNSQQNRIPPYEVNSNFDLGTYATDDFYVCVSGNELSRINDSYLDMSVGRLPVQDVNMAAAMVNKIINYVTNPEYGPWRGRITFVADDEFTTKPGIEPMHTQQSEGLANGSYMPDFLEQRKVYLMEYPFVIDVASSIKRKPAAQDALIDQINEGTAIINYVGHGNYRLLAHEWVIHREIDMPRIDNGRRLFYFYIASCEFGKWDFPDENSMAEDLLNAEGFGAIAIVSAGAGVFSGSNYILAEAHHKYLFNGTRTSEPIGNALMHAKTVVPGANSEKFHVLGDPAMRLSFPKNTVQNITLSADSLKAMSTVNVTGSLNYDVANEGKIHLSVFDSEKNRIHILPNGGQVYYKLPGASIFRGNDRIDPADNNQFDMSFIVPRDISYGGSNGRISIYFSNENGDGSGYISKIPVGGTATASDDVDGPETEIWLNNRFYVSGDIVPENPGLLLKLTDPHGINITGEIGHKIEMKINDRPVVNLSKLFEYESGSYTTGNVQYKLTGLDPGQNTFSFRVWDNFNNSSTVKGLMQVVAEDDLIVENVLNYPNPFSDETRFTCQVSYPAEIEIKIYTVKARLIKTIKGMQADRSSFFVSPVWNGRDEDGDKVANGTYLYKLIARAVISGTSKQVEKIGKLVIMR